MLAVYIPGMPDEPIETPIDGTLDLHTFAPRDVKSLVPEYIDACRQRGILQLRIVHGKGTGTLRETVRRELRKHPLVKSFRPGGYGEGGAGVTIVVFTEK